MRSSHSYITSFGCVKVFLELGNVPWPEARWTAYLGVPSPALGSPSHLSTQLLAPFDPNRVSYITDENTNHPSENTFKTDRLD